MPRSSRTLVAMAVAVALSLEFGVVAAQVRGVPRARPQAAAPTPTPAFVSAPAAEPAADPTFSPALSGSEAARLVAPPVEPPPALTVTSKPAMARRRARLPRRVAPAPVCPPTPAVPATRSTRARAIDGSVAVYSSPGAAKPSRTMANPRPEDNLPLEFLVRERRGEWLRVQLSVRPNMTHGWIKVSEVELSGLPYRIVVERCARRMTLYRDGQVVMREVVAVGKPQYPTPLGEFFVDYIYPFSMRSGYGPWLVSIAGFSDVLQSFGGGRGQIALHGTSARWSLGQAASHGCIRLSPEASTRLAKLVKPGTPVSIVA